jgi:hypothetical protein
MVLNNAGTISASQIRGEYNQTAGSFSLGSVGRGLDKRVPQSGLITYSNFYNKYYKPSTSNLKVWLDGRDSYSGSGTTWTDLQGNANGTLANTPTFSKPYFTFNGSTQYATLPSTSGITDFTTSNNYTVSCWVWISSTQPTGDTCIVEKWASGSGPYPYVVRYASGTSTIYMATYDSTTILKFSSTGVNLNDWNHITTVFDWTNNIMTLHVNGVQKTSSSVTRPGTINNATVLNIMRRGNSTNYATGRLGMLMIYNTALTAYQNKLLYYSTRNVFDIISTELENGTWNILYEYLNPTRSAGTALTISNDFSGTLSGQTINRIGYYMQNNMGDGSTTYWIYVTMDAYTTTLSQLKIPDLTNAFVNQRNVTNLQVYSNHPQVGNYTAANGRLEIWPYTYSTTTNLGGGNTNSYDFDDTSSGSGDYGSVQIHDITNSKTLLAWNNHKNGLTPDIGIGNNDSTNIHYNTTGGAQPTGTNPDWTGATNNAYNWKFQVLLGTVDLNPASLETGTWNVLYEFTDPRRDTVSSSLTYNKDNTSIHYGKTFARVGYFMQNNMNNGATSYYVYVTMDAYTTNINDLKIPDIANAFVNQRNVTNLKVYSNHPQVGNYTATNGRLEIWPYDYTAASNLGGGSGATYDFDDTNSGSGDYGCVQVHDITNSKTLLAWNMHRSTGTQNIGIGNNDATNIHYVSTGGASPDWTNAASSAYNWKFQIYIKI